MERIDGEDIDSFLLQMEAIFNQEPERDKDDGEWRKICGFRIWTPAVFSPADRESASEIFWSDYRPGIVFLTDRKTEGLTLQTLAETGMTDDTGGEDLIASVKRRLDTVDDRIVYYDTGVTDGDVKIHWIEYKSFAGEERVYNLLFLFRIDTKEVLGTFFCVFEEYERWKPIAWEMIRSIREEADERI